MIVTTLTFILVGFMLMILFSMIPVMMRIHSDFIGIGDIGLGGPRRYARDFQDFSEANGETRATGADAEDLAADKVGERVRYSGSETADTAEDLAETEALGGRTLSAAESRRLAAQTRPAGEPGRRPAPAAKDPKGEAIQDYVENAAGTATPEAGRIMREETPAVAASPAKTVDAALHPETIAPAARTEATETTTMHVSHTARDNTKAKAEDWFSAKTEEMKHWSQERIERMKRWLEK